MPAWFIYQSVSCILLRFSLGFYVIPEEKYTNVHTFLSPVPILCMAVINLSDYLLLPAWFTYQNNRCILLHFSLGFHIISDEKCIYFYLLVNHSYKLPCRCPLISIQFICQNVRCILLSFSTQFRYHFWRKLYAWSYTSDCWPYPMHYGVFKYNFHKLFHQLWLVSQNIPSSTRLQYSIARESIIQSCMSIMTANCYSNNLINAFLG